MDNVISVLIVDDNVELAKLIKEKLEQCSDLNVKGIANDGLEAISMIKDIKPEIVHTYKNLSLKGREELLCFIDSFINNLYSYINKWEKVRTAIKQDNNTEIKRIK
jgi:CheY-like chemotaxis protein